MLDSLPDAALVLDHRGFVVAENAAWVRRTALSPAQPPGAEAGGNYLAALEQAPDALGGSAGQAAEGLRRLLQNHEGPFALEYLTSVAGAETWLLLKATAQAETGGAVVTEVDVTTRRQAEELVAHRALHDPLTGLPNRTLLLDRLGTALRALGRRRTLVGVLFCDLDRFKVVNDSLGHAVGDQLLQEVARRLAGVVRPSDTVARLGGDEFVVLCDDLESADQCRSVADRLTEALRRPVDVGATQVTLGGSVGIALTSDANAEPEALLRDADAAMYRAKERGRGRAEMFQPELHRRMVHRLHLDRTLRDAIEDERLQLEFQPEISLDDGRVLGVEALVRCVERDGRLLRPGEFIELAEDTGLIVPLGRLVMRAACRAALPIERALGRTVPVWVNLSARQLSHPDLVLDVTRAVEEADVQPGTLCLELTESATAEGPQMVQVLRRLKGLGARLAVDDFGTGFSSLQYLKNLPVDVVKIDRSFTAGLGHDPGDAAIVRAIIGVADGLGMQSVAEGVESVTQEEELRRLGCAAAQGFHYARPLPLPGLLELLRDREGSPADH